ncbi:hypothetical protein TWF696_004741 [Orbilia brochopaga]|uniref:Uncharacterized protein n=1 Tax=Orbilia brochopaga TaxID=3140254 RepID=A0AAV9V2M2_9PEZI
MASHKPKLSVDKGRASHLGVTASKLSGLPHGTLNKRSKTRRDNHTMKTSDIIHLLITICSTIIFLADCFYFNESTMAWPAPVKPPFSIGVYASYSCICRYAVFYISRIMELEWHEERPLASRGFLEHLGLAVHQRQGRRLQRDTVDVGLQNTTDGGPISYRLDDSHPRWVINLRNANLVAAGGNLNNSMPAASIKSYIIYLYDCASIVLRILAQNLA